MFDFFRKKKQSASFSPRQEIERLTELSPPSTLIALVTKGVEEPEDMGKAFFLRKDKKLYTEGSHLYLTTPDGVKISKDQNLNAKNVLLQFFHRRVPHKMDCRIIGRFRLLPEVVETLDFSAKAAYKLIPTSTLKKEDKRQFLRYTLKNYGDSRIPLTTHIMFDLAVKMTNKEFELEGAPVTLLNDLAVRNYREDGNGQPFTTRDAINEFRDVMLRKQPHERAVFLTKIVKDDAGGLVRKPDVELLLGETNVLGLEMESLRDELYLKKSQKAGIKKGEENPYNLHPGEKILGNFYHDNNPYEMLIEVMEARTQNEVIRPIDFMKEEPGIRLDLIDYSIGGGLIESSPEFLRFVLGDKVPANVDDDPDFEGTYWQEAFEELKKPMIHLTLYPKVHFPDAVKQFLPEMPFKITIVGQIVRTHVAQLSDRTVLQHGVQFAYEAQGIPLKDDELVDWRYCRYIRDNKYLKDAHSHLTQLYGYLENQSMTSANSGARRQPPAAAG